jgi:hypothetical protein
MPVTAVSYEGEELPLAVAEQRLREGSLDWPFPFALFKVAVAAAKPRDFVSPSQLKSCPRQFVLKLRTDYTIELRDSVASMKGTALHALFEKALDDEDAHVTEERVTRAIDIEVDGETYRLALSGQPDSVAAEYATVEDYKTTGGYIKRDFDGYDSHKLQLSVYGWILRGNGVSVSRGRLYYLGNKQERRVDFPLMSDAEVEAAIRHYAPEYIRWLRNKDYLPPIPQDEEMLKWCATCPVRIACDAFDQEGL